MDPKWLDWARRLQAAAQNGLLYCDNPFERERYEAVGRVAAEILADASGADMQKVLDLFAEQGGYATPKVDVRGIVFRDNKLLMVKEKFDGRWTVPGGWADVTDAPSEAVVREIFEESGYRARATKVLAVYDRGRHGPVPPHPFRIYKLFFRCELTGGEPAASIETEAVEFFAENKLPELSAGRVTSQQIARFFEHLRNPDWPTDFD